MAEEQKNVDVPKDIQTAETTPAVTAITASEPVKEEIVTDKTEEPKPAEATEEAKAEETKPAEAEETKAEEKKEEVKPIEEGQLGHKAQGASFPKNLIGSKEFFFFGTDAFEKDALTNYTKTEKSHATAQANVAWATETGKGLLFIGDKKAPTGIINLSDATEPETEGANKFTLTSKGNKHSFKAANAAERDNWVAQLKLKIAEAKELATTVTESEKYKETIESFKPKPVAKKEETPAAAVAEAPKEETTAEEAAKAEEPAKEEDKVEEPKKAESPKPLKNKRASFFGFLDKKDKPVEEKKEETKDEEAKTEETPAVVAPAIDTDKPAEEVKPEEPKAETEAAKPEEKAAEEPKAESPKEKASKRNSFFGSILSKKEKKAVEPKAEEKEETKAEEPKTEEAAPVIPPVEATTPLAVDVNNTASTPAAETAESPATEAKKDPKEKRKSSLPFLGKREKSPAPAEGEDKSPKSAFSKFRATIKGKSAPKEEAKKEEATKEEPAKEEAKAEDKKDETVPEPAKVTPVVDDAAKPVEAETETKPENVATTTPAVTAAA